MSSGFYIVVELLTCVHTYESGNALDFTRTNNHLQLTHRSRVVKTGLEIV